MTFETCLGYESSGRNGSVAAMMERLVGNLCKVLTSSTTGRLYVIGVCIVFLDLDISFAGITGIAIKVDRWLRDAEWSVWRYSKYVKLTRLFGDNLGLAVGIEFENDSSSCGCLR